DEPAAAAAGHRRAEVVPHQDGAMSNGYSRRSFLHRAIATGALMDLPFLSRAHAAPLYNVIIVYVPDGVVPSLWYPTGTETSFTLPAMSEPLGAIKSDCVF